MSGSVRMEVSQEDIIKAVKNMRKGQQQAFLEDLLAATSPEYLASIRQARSEYKATKYKTHEQVFGR